MELTEQEILFCELFTGGEVPYCGHAEEAYREAFKVPSKTRVIAATKRLMAREEIKEQIAALFELNGEEGRDIKAFLTTQLKHIIVETTTAKCFGKRGVEISAAPMRSVAVAASKALMELYPVKAAQVSKLDIEGGGEAGITFNVVMPQATGAAKNDKIELK